MDLDEQTKASIRDQQMRLDRLCHWAIDLYGPAYQWGQISEECSELAAKASRMARGRTANDLADEVADVDIALYQARMMIGEEAFIAALDRKLDKLEEHIVNKLSAELKTAQSKSANDPSHGVDVP